MLEGVLLVIHRWDPCRLSTTTQTQCPVSFSSSIAFRSSMRVKAEADQATDIDARIVCL